jgi:hypothetical protein
MDERREAGPEADQVARDIARRRMRSVGLLGPPARGYAEVVRRLGAVQAQDYGPAKWSIAQRLSSATEPHLESVFADGKLIRTHVLRPTWHFVLPEDLRWMLELTAPRVHALNRYYYRQLGLDPALRQRCADLLAVELKGRNYLTRKEIGVLLGRSGIESSAMRLGYLLIHAELEGLICSGPRRGKQQTYALVEERVAPALARDREAALIELTRRYFTGHGPATVKDFHWWSSLPSTDIIGALEALGDQLVKQTYDGTSYWSGPRTAEAVGAGRVGRTPRVFLIQSYDEYVVGYTESKYVLDISGAARARPEGLKIFNQVILLDSQVAGHWRPTPNKHVVRIEAVLDAPFAPAQQRALQAAADEYAEFLGLTAELTTRSG